MPQDSAKPRRFGRPQIYAALLLAAFAAQCIVAARKESWMPTQRESEEALYSISLTYKSPVARFGDRYHSPLIYHFAGVVFQLEGGTVGKYLFVHDLPGWYLFRRIPFIIVGLLLGASLWYVARRLHGTAGACFALTLYCFSPVMIGIASHGLPDILAAWGFFGAVFLAIASAHTLYALPATLPWYRRWKRPLLLGMALAVGIAAEYSIVLAVPIVLALMVYLVPGHRREAVVQWVVACAIAVAGLLATFGFDFSALRRYPPVWPYVALHWEPRFPPDLHITRLSAISAAMRQSDPALLAMLGIAAVAWMLWPRTRWFGNTTALIAAALLPLAAPLYQPMLRLPEPARLWIPAVPFVFIFIGGVLADLVETQRRRLVLAIALGLLAAHLAFANRSLL